MENIGQDKISYFIGPRIEPVLEVPSGATVQLETHDCFTGNICSSTDKFCSYAESHKVLVGWNPITGPVAVRGAEPGGCLVVDILDIALPDHGVTTYIPGIGMFASAYQMTPDLEADTRICRIEDGFTYLPTGKGEVKIPVSPMIGTICVSPCHETIASFKFGAEHCGNVDCKEITSGNQLILPVNVPGALFGLGDVHAAQGDGEISCVAVEIAAKVTVRLTASSREEVQFLSAPQINGPDFIGSIGCHFGQDIGQNIKHAYFDLLRRLENHYGYTATEAYHLLSQVGEVRVCQVLGNHQAAMAKINRRFL